MNFNETSLEFKNELFNITNRPGLTLIDYYSPPPAVTAIVLTIFGLVLLTGIVGNIFVMVIIGCVKGMRTTVNACLFSLAMTDLIILIILPLGPIIDDFTNATVPIGKHVCRLRSLCYQGVRVCSVCTYLYATIDRYFAICHPLKSRRAWSGKYVYIILVVIWVVSLLSSIPILLNSKYQVVDYRNVTHYLCYIYTGEEYMIWYDTVIYFFLLCLPIPVLATLYGRMVRSLRTYVGQSDTDAAGRRRQGAQKMAGHRGRGHVVIMLIILLVIFMVSQIPISTLNFLTYHFPSVFFFFPYTKSKFILAWTCRILFYINSAINPVIYFLLSTNFRRGFRKVFCCRQK